jgi:nucleotide-binding universal stress UspA family protein
MSAIEDIATRIQLKNVLFLTDLSRAANYAAPWAAGIAVRYGAQVYVLHVRPPAVNPMTYPSGWTQLEADAVAKAAEERRELLTMFADAAPEILIKEGDFWSNLSSVIEDKQIDLIVMGTHGWSGAAKMLLGSTTEEVFRHVHSPVLTIGPNCLSADGRRGEFHKILFASGLDADAATAAHYAVSLAQEYQAALTLVHVIAEQKPGDLVSAPDLRESSERLLKKLVPAASSLWCDIEYIVQEGPVAEKILKVADRQESDLIVLGVHAAARMPGLAEHWPLSVAHSIVSQAECPVLTVHT